MGGSMMAMGGEAGTGMGGTGVVPPPDNCVETGSVNGFNTELRALEPYDKSRNVPTDVEIGKSIEDAIKKAAQSDYTPFKPFNNSSSGGFNPYRRYSGGGGGGSYTPQMRPLPYNVAPYGNSTPFINTSNPIIRRASLSRQRIESDRGRLFQWQ